MCEALVAAGLGARLHLRLGQVPAPGGQALLLGKARCQVGQGSGVRRVRRAKCQVTGGSGVRWAKWPGTPGPGARYLGQGEQDSPGPGPGLGHILLTPTAGGASSPPPSTAGGLFFATSLLPTWLLGCFPSCVFWSSLPPPSPSLPPAPPPSPNLAPGGPPSPASTQHLVLVKELL